MGERFPSTDVPVAWKRERTSSLYLSLSLYMYIYIYIYTPISLPPSHACYIVHTHAHTRN